MGILFSMSGCSLKNDIEIEYSDGSVNTSKVVLK